MTADQADCLRCPDRSCGAPVTDRPKVNHVAGCSFASETADDIRRYHGMGASGCIGQHDTSCPACNDWREAYRALLAEPPMPDGRPARYVECDDCGHTWSERERFAEGEQAERARVVGPARRLMDALNAFDDPSITGKGQPVADAWFVLNEAIRSTTPVRTADQERADAIVAVAKLLPEPRRIWDGMDEWIHPPMPEDDAALTRTVQSLVNRGDHLADDINDVRKDLNELGRAWHEGERTADELLSEFFENECMPSGTQVYEWQKSRERMAWVAEHRHVAAYREAGTHERGEQ